MKGETVFFALGDLEEDLIHEARQSPPRRSALLRRLPLVAAVAALLTALITVAAVAAPFLPWNPRYITATGDEIISLGGDSRTLRSGGRDVCVVRDGRILFLCWDEELDITDQCSESEYYTWETTYADGVRELVLAGGTPEAAGWLYVYFLSDKVLTFDTPCAYDYEGAEWFWRGVADYGLDFLCPEPPDYGDLAVPTTKELLEHGYPVNALGETYGPYVPWLPDPDLGLAQGKDGVIGYLRQSELDEVTGVGQVHSAEEAVAWTEYVRQRGPVEVPLYKEDGVTVVGGFVIGS